MDNRTRALKARVTELETAIEETLQMDWSFLNHGPDGACERLGAAISGESQRINSVTDVVNVDRPGIVLGDIIRIDDHDAKVVEICEEPDTGLVIAEYQGWSFKVPAVWMGEIKGHQRKAALLAIVELGLIVQGELHGVGELTGLANRRTDQALEAVTQRDKALEEVKKLKKEVGWWENQNSCVCDMAGTCARCQLADSEYANRQQTKEMTILEREVSNLEGVIADAAQMRLMDEKVFEARLEGYGALDAVIDSIGKQVGLHGEPAHEVEKAVVEELKKLKNETRDARNLYRGFADGVLGHPPAEATESYLKGFGRGQEVR